MARFKHSANYMSEARFMLFMLRMCTLHNEAQLERLQKKMERTDTGAAVSE